MSYRIEALDINHRSALDAFTKEFADAGEEHIPAFLTDPAWTFEEIISNFDKQERGEGLPEGWVPGTTRFLVHDDRILGVFNLRHWLTDGLKRFGGHVGYSVRPSERRKGYGVRLLEAAKALAKETDIDRVLVTCDVANVASSKVIEKCGGALENQFFHDELGYHVSRYWITLI